MYFGDFRGGSRDTVLMYVRSHLEGLLEGVDKEIWRYDPMLSNWKKIETTGEPPKTMASHAACSFDKVIKAFL